MKSLQYQSFNPYDWRRPYGLLLFSDAKQREAPCMFYGIYCATNIIASPDTGSVSTIPSVGTIDATMIAYVKQYLLKCKFEKWIFFYIGVDPGVTNQCPKWHMEKHMKLSVLTIKLWRVQQHPGFVSSYLIIKITILAWCWKRVLR